MLYFGLTQKYKTREINSCHPSLPIMVLKKKFEWDNSYCLTKMYNTFIRIFKELSLSVCKKAVES